MSAFLGPIHYWLWNKIKVQDEMVKTIIDFAKETLGSTSLQEEIEGAYGTLEQGALEENINEGNIHGWLQQRVTLVERSLAKAVKTLLDKNKVEFATLETLFYEEGKKRKLPETFGVKEAFKHLEDMLLDGMPCDRANEIIEETDEKVVWKRNHCVHKQYWDEVGEDISYYYRLREAFIKGMVEGTKIVFRKIDESTNELGIS